MSALTSGALTSFLMDVVLNDAYLVSIVIGVVLEVITPSIVALIATS